MEQLNDKNFIAKNSKMTIEEFLTQHCAKKCTEITEVCNHAGMHSAKARYGATYTRACECFGNTRDTSGAVQVRALISHSACIAPSAKMIGA